MEKFKVGVIGGTGMVGQRFVTLMQGHPWFQLTVIAASPRSAGKRYEEAVAGRWAMDVPIPDEAKDMILMSAQDDVEQIASMVDFVFSAVDMKKEEIKCIGRGLCQTRVSCGVQQFRPPLDAGCSHGHSGSQSRAYQGDCRPAQTPWEQREALLPSSPTVPSRAMFPLCPRCGNLTFKRSWCVLTKLSLGRAKPLRLGQTWWITSSRTLAERRKKVSRSR